MNKLEQENERLIGIVEKLEKKVAELQPLKKWRVLYTNEINAMQIISAHFVRGSGHYEVSDAEYVFGVNKGDSYDTVARIPKVGVLSVVEVTE